MPKIWRPPKEPLEAVGVKDAQGVAVGKMWRPRRPAKAPLKAVGAKGVAVDGEVEASVLGAPVVAAARGGEKGPLEDGIEVCRMDALDGAPVIATTRQEQEAVGVKDTQGVVVRKMWRPRRPAKAPLKAVGVKDAKGVAVIAVDGEVEASVLGAPVVAVARGGEKGPLKDGTAVCLMDSLDGAPVIATTRQEHEAVRVKEAQGVAVGKMWQPRRPAKARLEAVGVKDAQGVAVIAVDGEVEASVLGAPVVAVARGGEKGPLKDGTAVCLMDSLDGAPVIATTRQEHEAVRVKEAEGVAVGKMWQPRRPAKVRLEAVGVKDAQGVAVIAVDGEVEASVLGAPVVAVARGGEKGPLKDGTAVCLMDSLDGAPVIATTRQEHEAVRVKEAEGVAVGKMWQPRRPAKVRLEAVGVKDAQGVAVIAVDGEVEASVLGAPVVAVARGGEKGPLKDGTAVCLMDSLDGAPVIATTRQEHEAVRVKEAEGVAVGKMWQPRRPAKVPLEAVGVKDAQGVVVRKMWRPRRPVKAPLKAVGVKDAETVAMGKMWQPQRPANVPLEAVGVKNTQGVAVITIERKVEASLIRDPVVAAARGGEKGPLEEGIAVCQMDTPDGAPVMTRQEAVGVKDAEGVAVGKMWRPRQLAMAPLEALGVKDVEGVAVFTVDRKVEASILGAPVIMAAEGGEKGPLEEGIMVCQVDALAGASVIAMTQQEALGGNDTEEVAVGKMWQPRRPAKAPLEAAGVKDAEGVAVIAINEVVKPLVLGVPEVAVAGGGEKGSLEDGIVVCRMDALHGAPVIATDEKEDVSVQRDLVFPVVAQKVDAPVVKGVEAITVNGNGKEEKDKEGIKWLKHYSTAQSILIVGDGDFSFSLALATTFGSGGNLVATSLDSYEALTIKYGKAESNVRELKRLGATVLHGVDAKKMKLHLYLEMRRFDRIVFNFPHAGFNGRESWLRVIKAHKQLVRGFLANARQLLRPYGEIHLSHKTGLPYDAWDIEQLAYESCLIMVRKVGFSKEDYPGYNQKKGAGVTCDESFPLGPCCTFMFCVGDVEKLKQAHGNRVGSISSCLGDSKFYPGISATDMIMKRPFDLHPAWPQPHFPPLHLPIAFDPCPFGAAGMEYPFDCYGTSFHHQEDMVQPTNQEQPWYQVGPPPIQQPWTPQEQQSLRREYEIHRQLTPSLEDRYMESVERQAMLEMLIQVYSRQ